MRINACCSIQMEKNFLKRSTSQFITSIAGDRRGIPVKQAGTSADMVNHKPWEYPLHGGLFTLTVCQHVRQFGQAMHHLRGRFRNQTARPAAVANRVTRTAFLPDKPEPVGDEFSMISPRPPKATRHPATDNFTQTGQIRLNIIMCLEAPPRRQGSRSSLRPDNQQRTELKITQGAQAAGKSR